MFPNNNKPILTRSHSSSSSDSQVICETWERFHSAEESNISDSQVLCERWERFHPAEESNISDSQVICERWERFHPAEESNISDSQVICERWERFYPAEESNSSDSQVICETWEEPDLDVKKDKDEKSEEDIARQYCQSSILDKGNQGSVKHINFCDNLGLNELFIFDNKRCLDDVVEEGHARALISNRELESQVKGPLVLLRSILLSLQNSEDSSDRYIDEFIRLSFPEKRLEENSKELAHEFLPIFLSLTKKLVEKGYKVEGKLFEFLKVLLKYFVLIVDNEKLQEKYKGEMTHLCFLLEGKVQEILGEFNDNEVVKIFCIFADYGVLEVLSKSSDLISGIAKRMESVDYSSIGVEVTNFFLVLFETYFSVNLIDNKNKLGELISNVIKGAGGVLCQNYDDKDESSLSTLLELFEADRITAENQAKAREILKKEKLQRASNKSCGKKTFAHPLQSLEENSKQIPVEMQVDSGSGKSLSPTQEIAVRDVLPLKVVVKPKSTITKKVLKTRVLEKLLKYIDNSKGYILSDLGSENQLCHFLDKLIKDCNYQTYNLKTFQDNFESLFSNSSFLGEVSDKAIVRIFLSVGFWVKDPSEILSFLWKKIRCLELKKQMIKDCDYYSLFFALTYFHRDSGDNDRNFIEVLLEMAKETFLPEEMVDMLKRLFEKVCDLYGQFNIDQVVDDKKLILYLKPLVRFMGKNLSEEYIKDVIYILMENYSLDERLFDKFIVDDFVNSMIKSISKNKENSLVLRVEGEFLSFLSELLNGINIYSFEKKACIFSKAKRENKESSLSIDLRTFTAILSRGNESALQWLLQNSKGARFSRTVQEIILLHDCYPIIFAINTAATDSRGLKMVRPFLDKLSEKQFKAMLKNVFSHLKDQKLYQGLAWNARQAFSEFLSLLSRKRLRLVELLLEKLAKYQPVQEGVPDLPFEYLASQDDLREGQKDPYKRQQDLLFFQDNVRDSSEFPVASVAVEVFHKLKEITFTDDDLQNPQTWSGVDQINSFMNQAIVDSDNLVANYISPINYAFDSNEYAQYIAETICQRKTYDEWINNKDKSRPFIFIANTQTVLSASSVNANKLGGLHWVGWVLLPKKYLSLSGKEVNNDKYQVFFFDPKNKESFPKNLREVLTVGIEIVHNVGNIDRRVEMAPFCKGEELDFCSFPGNQMNGSDCGWWVVYYTLMVVYTGGVECFEHLRNKKLSAIPLRSIMHLEDELPDKEASSKTAKKTTDSKSKNKINLPSDQDFLIYSFKNFVEHSLREENYKICLTNFVIHDIAHLKYRWTEERGVIFGVEGYCGTLLKKLHQFKKNRDNKILIYILGKDGNHWVTLVAVHASNSNCQKDAFFYADSFGSGINQCLVSNEGKGQRPDDAKRGVTQPLDQFLEDEGYSKNSIHSVSVKQQRDFYNCGLFALENADTIFRTVKNNSYGIHDVKESIKRVRTDLEFLEGLRREFAITLEAAVSNQLEKTCKRTLPYNQSTLTNASHGSYLQNFFDGLVGILENIDSKVLREEKIALLVNNMFHGYKANSLASLLLGQFLCKNQRSAKGSEKYLLLYPGSRNVAFLLTMDPVEKGRAVVLNVIEYGEKCMFPDVDNFPINLSHLQIINLQVLSPGFSFCKRISKINFRHYFSVSSPAKFAKEHIEEKGSKIKFIPIDLAMSAKIVERVEVKENEKNIEGLIEFLKKVVKRIVFISKLDDNRSYFFVRGNKDNIKALIEGLLMSDQGMTLLDSKVEKSLIYLVEEFYGFLSSIDPISPKKRAAVSSESVKKTIEKKTVGSNVDSNGFFEQPDSDQDSSSRQKAKPYSDDSNILEVRLPKTELGKLTFLEPLSKRIKKTI